MEGQAEVTATGTIGFRPAPRAAPRASRWPGGSEDRLTVRIDPRQPPLPWASDEPAPSAAGGPPTRSGRPPAGRAGVVRVARFGSAAITPGLDPPDPARWAARLAEALLEVLDGRRPVGQLEPWLSQSALSQLARRIRRRGARDRPSVFALHLHRDTPRVAEVVAVYGWPDRRAAMAFRLEADRQTWLCTGLVLTPVASGAVSRPAGSRSSPA